MTSPAADCMDLARCHKCAVRLCYLSFGINLALAAAKVLLGSASGSHTLTAGALYSLNDLLSALVMLISLRVAKRPADADHAYGHGKTDFLAVGVVGVVLAAGAIFIAYEAILVVAAGVDGPPHILAILVALPTLAVGEFLARRGFCAAERLRSLAVHTAAEHSRADAVSSIAIIVGVGGAALGLHILDALVAIFETAHIAWLAVNLLRTAGQGLMDRSLPPDQVERIRHAFTTVPDVTELVDLRTRSLGSSAWTDAVVAIPCHLSVEAAHRLAEQIRATVAGVVDRPITTTVRFKPAQPLSAAMPS